MSDPCTLRILELDGGGARGYLSLQFLRKFVNLWGIADNELWKYFDVICGTSIGGIMTLAIANGTRLSELAPFFTDTSQLVFSTNGERCASIGTVGKTADFFAGDTFYGTDSGTEYGSALLYDTIRTLSGTTTLQELKTTVLVPSYRMKYTGTDINDLENDTFESASYVYFSNFSNPAFISGDVLASDVALATSAAPLYLPPFVVQSGFFHTRIDAYIDGGVYQNNPGQLGKILGKMKKPLANRICVFSLGTGEVPPPELRQDPGVDDAITFLENVIKISTGGSQEAVATSLLLESSYTLEQLYYYRFQPLLTPPEGISTDLDQTTNETFAYYDQVASDWFVSDSVNINNFLAHLTA